MVLDEREERYAGEGADRTWAGDGSDRMLAGDGTDRILPAFNAGAAGDEAEADGVRAGGWGSLWFGGRGVDVGVDMVT